MKQKEFLDMIADEGIEYISAQKTALASIEIRDCDIFRAFATDKEIMDDFLIWACMRRGLK